MLLGDFWKMNERMEKRRMRPETLWVVEEEAGWKLATYDRRGNWWTANGELLLLNQDCHRRGNAEFITFRIVYYTVSASWKMNGTVSEQIFRFLTDPRNRRRSPNRKIGILFQKSIEMQENIDFAGLYRMLLTTVQFFNCICKFWNIQYFLVHREQSTANHW